MIENENLLIDALTSFVGEENLLVFTGGSMDTQGLIRQATIFSHAKVVLGMLLTSTFNCIYLRLSMKLAF